MPDQFSFVKSLRAFSIKAEATLNPQIGISLTRQPDSKVAYGFLLSLKFAIPLFFLSLIASTGIEYPFWDHVEIGSLLISVKDGTASLDSFFAPHNEHRIVIPRIIFVGLALLTDWNITFELALVGLTLILVLVILHRELARQTKVSGQNLCSALLVLLIFSPSAHNILWWSFGLALVLVCLFTYLAFIQITLDNTAVTNNFLAFIFSLMASLTMANGVVAFATIAVLHFTVLIFRPGATRRNLYYSIFWLFCTFAAVLSLPSDTGSTGSPQISSIFEFVLLCVGTPLRSLFDFPYNNMFHVPELDALSYVSGAVVSLLCTYAAILAIGRISRGDNNGLFAIACIAFGIGTAFAIAIGRANFDEFAMANAQASRYNIFSTFCLVGCLFSFSSSNVPANIGTKVFSIRRVSNLFFWLLLFFSIASYHRSLPIFHQSDIFNGRLGLAYSSSLMSNKYYSIVYPDAAYFEEVKLGLMAYQLGPYRRSFLNEPDYPADKVFSPTAFGATEKFEHRVTTPANGCGIDYRIVTWGYQHEDFTVHWRILSSGELVSEETKVFNLVEDWQHVRIPLPSERTEYVVQIWSNDRRSVGLPTYQSSMPNSLAISPTETKAFYLAFSDIICR